MLTILFMILMFAILGKLFIFALKAAWGISKVLVFLVLLPFIIIAGIISGLLSLVFPLLVIMAIVYLVKRVCVN